MLIFKVCRDILRPLPQRDVCKSEAGPKAPPRANLPGWRWGTITKIPLVAVSRPLHSGVCETRQDAGLPVIHSAISDSGRLRTRGGQPSNETKCLLTDHNS